MRQPITHRAAEVVASQRRPQLDLDEDIAQAAVGTADLGQSRQLRLQVEAGGLALGEAVDGLHDLTGRQTQGFHDAARGGDLALADPAVGLGHMSHDAEGGVKEQLPRICLLC